MILINKDELQYFHFPNGEVNFDMKQLYGADIENEMVGTSIPATEHSVMCAHGQDELESYRYLITEVYPSGFVSIVSDTWDLWDIFGGTVENGFKSLDPHIGAIYGDAITLMELLTT